MFDIQLSLFEDYKPYEKINEKIYGENILIYPHIPSKCASPYDQKKFLKHLLPLEEYDHIIVAYSGGKDCTAAFLYLLDLNIPQEKLILMHHDIDGGEHNPILEMDWPITKSYCEQFARTFSVPVKYSWREGGFSSELLRVGPSAPVVFEEFDSEKTTRITGDRWDYSQKLRAQIDELMQQDKDEEAEELMLELKKMGYRLKWPAKSASLSTRWCSSALKVEVCDRVIRYANATFMNKNILIIDGIRREESNNRRKYNEMELHTTNAPTKARTVHLWRPVIEWSEEMVWDIIKRYRIRANPCYYLGWSRASCALCIFGLAMHWSGIREVLPDRFNRVVELERELDFTIDNSKDLISYIGNAKSCVPNDVRIEYYLNTMRSGIIPDDYILFEKGKEWEMPSGAFMGAAGGPC